MARSIPALVQPSLLVWARETAGFRIEDVAKKAQVELETVREWERGAQNPSIAQLRRLGAVYKRPLGVFFLQEPPKGFDPQREFRRLPGLSPERESSELRLALRMALFRRQAALELYDRLGEELPTLHTAAHPDEDPEVVAQRIRQELNVPWKKQLEWSTPYTALNAWREAIEQLGVLVFQTGGVELSEMRGTSIPHGPVPVVLLNNNDAPHGRIFTLLHEFVHILLANGGHRTSAMEGERLAEEQALERTSNQFTAATLMPQKEFLDEVSNVPGVLSGNDDALRRLANRVKVSPEAIFRRLLSLHRVSASLYRMKRNRWQEQSWFTPPQGEGGPPIQVKVVSAVGRSFVSLVLQGYHRNLVSSADVSDYLGTQLKYLDKIAGELRTKPGTPAYSSEL